MVSKIRTAPSNQLGKKRTRVRGRIGDHPNPVDSYVGKRIRLQRSLLGYSQQSVARMLGLTFQQVQKYERGDNRLSASRLWDMACILGVSTDFFYQDMDEETQKQSPMCLNSPEMQKYLPGAEKREDPMQRQETLELVSAYYKIANRSLAHTMLNALKLMSISNHMLAKENSPEEIRDGVNALLAQEDRAPAATVENIRDSVNRMLDKNKQPAAAKAPKITRGKQPSTKKRTAAGKPAKADRKTGQSRT